MDDGLTKDEILETLRVLSSVYTPIWLAGGLAADFHVGRWTRDHHDIDLVGYEQDRLVLFEELAEKGFIKTDDRGWITRWTRAGRDVGEVSLAFMKQVAHNTGHLVIREEYREQGLEPGIYPGVPGNLKRRRFRLLEGIRFRVVSPEDEWVFAKGYSSFRPGAPRRDSVEHNLGLLETVISENSREQLKPWIQRRLPLGDESALTGWMDKPARPRLMFVVLAGLGVPIVLVLPFLIPPWENDRDDNLFFGALFFIVGIIHVVFHRRLPFPLILYRGPSDWWRSVPRRRLQLFLLVVGSAWIFGACVYWIGALLSEG